jgi:hypothetical protein
LWLDLAATKFWLWLDLAAAKFWLGLFLEQQPNKPKEKGK